MEKILETLTAEGFDAKRSEEETVFVSKTIPKKGYTVLGAFYANGSWRIRGLTGTSEGNHFEPFIAVLKEAIRTVDAASVV